MKKNLTLLAGFLCLAGALFGQGISSKTNDPSVERMEANRKTNTPFSILFKENAPYSTGDAQKVFSKYLGLRQSIDELKLKDKNVSNGITVQRYGQYFKGIKVEHGNYIATSKNNVLSFITGDFYTIDEGTTITPQITAEEALSKALAHIGAAKYKWELPEEEAFLKSESGDPAATYRPKAELVLTEDFMTDGVLTGKVRLAYKFNIYAHKPVSRTNIFIDAATGKVLLADAEIKHAHDLRSPSVKNNALDNERKSPLLSPLATGTAATRYSGTVSIPATLTTGTYRLQAAVATEGYPLRTRNLNKGTSYGAATNFTDVDNNWTAAEFNNANYDNVALDAHWGAAKVYDYWKTRHGRNSYNNANAVINSYVHLDVAYDNAYWDGTQMSYGDGTNVAGGFTPLTALDVCGHEIGHAVCENTANLAYNRESGALNEGFSDIWGASIEHFADPFEADAVAKRYFDIGEEIGLPNPNSPLRSMSDPKSLGYPATYLGTYWQDATVAGCPTPGQTTNDYCGVHTNSSVLNYWFYLIVSGKASGTNDIGNSYSVPAIGWVDAEKITFLAESNLTPSATYAACRTASINAATTLFGTCSLQTEAVTRAWYGVNVGADFVPCTPQISFAGTAAIVSEAVASTTCGGTKVITVPLKISSAATGGNAVATVTVTGGTATAGKDYVLGTGAATFTAGSASNQNISITINDDGSIEGTETVQLLLSSVAANGSNASKANVYLNYNLSITDDDKAEDNGGPEVHTAGVNSTALNNTSPFHSISRSARTQYIIPAADLVAAGIRPNTPITKISVNVTTKGSTQAFTGYTISMGNTAATTVATAFVTGLTQVFTGNVTTVVGANNFTLSPTFSWDGTSNVAMQVCFANGSAGTANDGTEGYTGTLTSSTVWVASATASGCGTTFATTNLTAFTPVFTFTQSITPTAIESTLNETRQWTMDETGSNDNFYSATDGELIAKVKSNNAALGCVTATVIDAGTVWPAFLSGTRSKKAIQITPTTNVTATGYNVTLYYSVAEMGGKAPAAVKLYKTTASSIALANGGNTTFVTPTVVTNSTGTWYSFSGNFTGFSTFFLGDQSVVVPVSLAGFKAIKEGSIAGLYWNVEQQLNISNYIAESAADGVSFKAIGTVPANQSATASYTLKDAHPYRGANYYRIKTIDADGSFTYSNVVKLSFSGTEALVVTPSPVADNYTIYYSASNKIRSIAVFDMTGKKLEEFNPANSEGSIYVNASNYVSGMYVVRMVDADNKITSQKIIKK